MNKGGKRYKSYGTVFSDVRVCVECGCEYDVELVPTESYTCYPCFSGFHKKESKLDKLILKGDAEVQPRTFSKKRKRSEAQGKEKLPVGVSKRNLRGHLFYIARYSSFTISFSVSKYGEKPAKYMAKKVRRNMEKIKDFGLISEYLDEIREEQGKNLKKGTNSSLPKGVIFGEQITKSGSLYEFYRAYIIFGKEILNTSFNVRKLGKQKALELALKTREKMLQLGSKPKVKAFLSTEVEGWKKQYDLTKRDNLPKGVSRVKEFYRKDGSKIRRVPECYQVTTCRESKSVNIRFPIELYGENEAKDLAFYFNTKSKNLSLDQAKLLYKREGKEIKKLKGFPNLAYDKEDGYYEYSFTRDVFEGEIFVDDNLITFESDNLQDIRTKMVEAIEERNQ